MGRGERERCADAGVFFIAFEQAHNRRWRKCYLVLHGTKLEVHKARRTPWHSRSSKEVDASKPAGWRAGSLLESYTLQLAEVGTATDYKKWVHPSWFLEGWC